MAGDSAEAEGIKVLARTHKTLIWERTRPVQRLWHQIREYFPAAPEAFDDLDAADTLDCWARHRRPTVLHPVDCGCSVCERSDAVDPRRGPGDVRRQKAVQRGAC